MSMKRYDYCISNLIISSTLLVDTSSKCDQVLLAKLGWQTLKKYLAKNISVVSSILKDLF